MPVQIPATLLLIQRTVNVPVKGADDGPSAWPGSGPLGSVWLSPSCFRNLASKSEEEDASLSCQAAFLIDEYTFLNGRQCFDVLLFFQSGSLLIAWESSGKWPHPSTHMGDPD